MWHLLAADTIVEWDMMDIPHIVVETAVVLEALLRSYCTLGAERFGT